MAALTLAACGGGGGGSVTPPPPNNNPPPVVNPTPTPTPTPSVNIEADSIETMNVTGSHVVSNADYEVIAPSQTHTALQSTTLNTCQNGTEFFYPDKNGDANSTEFQSFYDSSCTQLAMDVLRHWQSGGSGNETVQRTVSQYPIGAVTPKMVRVENVSYSNGSYTNMGFPVMAAGLTRQSTDELDIAGTKTLVWGDEFIASSVSGNVLSYCSDTSGYSVIGNASLNVAFGWVGQTDGNNGTRTVNSDGSITFQTTELGTPYTGPIGGLNLTPGTPNASCAIASPMFAVAGGKSLGTYTLPVTMQFLNGALESITVTNAQFPNGEILNVQTNTSDSPTNPNYITGTVTLNGTTVATFNVNAYGWGALQIVNGQNLPISVWHVVR